MNGAKQSEGKEGGLGAIEINFEKEKKDLVEAAPLPWTTSVQLAELAAAGLDGITAQLKAAKRKAANDWPAHRSSSS